MMQIVGGRAGALALLMTLLVALSSGAGRAADLSHAPYYTPEGPLSSFSWIGPYLGGNLGYEWGSTSNNPTRPSGIAGGIQGGYNWQSGQFVFGAEADIQLAAANDTFAPWKFSNPWFGTGRGRAGYAMGSLLLYGTAGLAFGELSGQTFGLVSESHTNLGWTAGVGAEAAIYRRWSAKVEYLFVDLASSTFAITGASNGLSANIFRAGVNYHF